MRAVSALLAGMLTLCTVGTRVQARDEPQLAAEAPLVLEGVITSLRTHHPLIAGERAALRAARGDALAAQGEFDTTLTVQARVAALGYYDPRRLDVLIEQPTGALGATVYGGYRVTRGKVAPYYGEHNTLDGGELRGGVRVPLLADSRVDGRRTQVRTSEAQVQAERHMLAETLLDLEREAALAYFTWLAAGQRLSEVEALLELARVRDAQISAKVALGALPSIEQVDNARSVLERQRQLVSARRAFEKAALDLSLYVRGPTGEPRVPAVSELPESASPRAPQVSGTLLSAEAAALATRPELSAYEAMAGAARAERELAENRTLPRLDALLEVSKDFGAADAALAPTLEPTVLEAGVVFSMPLWLRKARGKLQAAEAKLTEAQQKARFARDKVRVEVRDAWSQLQAARERVEVADQAAKLAEQLATGERERFELGATTVLFVNLREQGAADARMALIDASAEVQYSAARLLTVMGQSPAR